MSAKSSALSNIIFTLNVLSDNEIIFVWMGLNILRSKNNVNFAKTHFFKKEVVCKYITSEVSLVWNNASV